MRQAGDGTPGKLDSSPVPRRDERRPVKRVRAQPLGAPVSQHADTCRMSGLERIELSLQSGFVKRTHPLARGGIFDGPQAHDYGAGAGDLKRAAEAEDAFASPDRAQAGIAS